VAEFGRLDILVNNAAHQMSFDKLEDIPDDEFERTFRTNLFPQFWLAKAAVPHMKPGATIVNTTSINAKQPSKQLLPYTTSKAAILNFTAGLAELLADKGIRVNAVAPGPVWTPLIPSTMPAQHVAEFGKNVPLGRPAQPAELAPAYVYLASDYATAGQRNISIIDSDSFWVAAHFEETKLQHIHPGDPATVALMGFTDPVLGHIESIARHQHAELPARHARPRRSQPGLYLGAAGPAHPGAGPYRPGAGLGGARGGDDGDGHGRAAGFGCALLAARRAVAPGVGLGASRDRPAHRTESTSQGAHGRDRVARFETLPDQGPGMGRRDALVLPDDEGRRQGQAPIPRSVDPRQIVPEPRVERA